MAKTVMFWIAIALSAVLLWTVVKTKSTTPIPEISYSDFLSQVEVGKVGKVTLSRTQAVGTRADGSTFRVSIPAAQEGLLQLLHQKNVEIWVAYSDDTSAATWVFNLILPVAVLAGPWFFMIRQMKIRQAKPPEGTRPADIG